MKYVLVSGGVMSGLGKGISSSSIGLLLQKSGLIVTSVKIDPYLNMDAGTMSPYEHGEVYVLADSGEADLDLGNYERFLNIQLTRDHNITTGKIYRDVLDRERRGDYLGKTVQVIPHITDCVQDWIEKVAQVPIDGSGETPDVTIIELGGTVGDIESEIYLESLRQLKYRVGADNFCHVHVSLTPSAGEDQEQKSKPTQHAVKYLLSSGLPPDLIFCRATAPLERSVAKKISLFCMVPPTNVISVHNVSNVMHVPQLLLEQNVPGLILNHLRMNRSAVESIPQWTSLAHRVDNAEDIIKIAIVGKYTSMHDAYLSVIKSLFYASIHCNRKVENVWIEASDLESATRDVSPELFTQAWATLKGCHGILVPGGFGDRGVEGMILAAHYAREKNIPYFGICLGFQVAVIEFCRSQLQLATATSGEFDPNTPSPVIIHMHEISKDVLGGTMRLGAHYTQLAPGSLGHYIYGTLACHERHRHRYEVNPQYINEIHSAGGRFTGTDDKIARMEMFELDIQKHPHPFFLGVQYHPEFLSRPLAPSPPFLAFVLAAAGLFDLRQPPMTIQARHPSFPKTKTMHNFAWSNTSNAVDDANPLALAVSSPLFQPTSPRPPELFIPEDVILTSPATVVNTAAAAPQETALEPQQEQ